MAGLGEIFKKNKNWRDKVTEERLEEDLKKDKSFGSLVNFNPYYFTYLETPADFKANMNNFRCVPKDHVSDWYNDYVSKHNRYYDSTCMGSNINQYGRSKEVLGGGYLTAFDSRFDENNYTTDMNDDNKKMQYPPNFNKSKRPRVNTGRIHLYDYFSYVNSKLAMMTIKEFFNENFIEPKSKFIICDIDTNDRVEIVEYTTEIHMRTLHKERIKLIGCQVNVPSKEKSGWIWVEIKKYKYDPKSKGPLWIEQKNEHVLNLIDYETIKDNQKLVNPINRKILDELVKWKTRYNGIEISYNAYARNNRESNSVEEILKTSPDLFVMLTDAAKAAGAGSIEIGYTDYTESGRRGNRLNDHYYGRAVDLACVDAVEYKRYYNSKLSSWEVSEQPDVIRRFEIAFVNHPKNRLKILWGPWRFYSQKYRNGEPNLITLYPDLMGGLWDEDKYVLNKLLEIKKYVKIEVDKLILKTEKELIDEKLLEEYVVAKKTFAGEYKDWYPKQKNDIIKEIQKLDAARDYSDVIDLYKLPSSWRPMVDEGMIMQNLDHYHHGHYAITEK